MTTSRMGGRPQLRMVRMVNADEHQEMQTLVQDFANQNKRTLRAALVSIGLTAFAFFAVAGFIFFMAQS